MGVNGLVVPPGQGRKLITNAQEITFKVTGAHGSYASVFEVVVPPGFDVGAHTHDQAEFFYVLEGELDLFAFEPVNRTGEGWQDWESPDGDRVIRAGAGSCMFVPRGCPHAFSNPAGTPARMLFQSYPAPDHERYFEELCEIFSRSQAVNSVDSVNSVGSVDSGAVQRLRDRYHLTQITPLRYRPAPPQP